MTYQLLQKPVKLRRQTINRCLAEYIGLIVNDSCEGVVFLFEENRQIKVGGAVVDILIGRNDAGQRERQANGVLQREQAARERRQGQIRQSCDLLKRNILVFVRLLGRKADPFEQGAKIRIPRKVNANRQDIIEV